MNCDSVRHINKTHHIDPGGADDFNFKKCFENIALHEDLFKGNRNSKKITYEITRPNGGYARLGWFVRPKGLENVSTMFTGPGEPSNWWSACASA